MGGGIDPAGKSAHNANPGLNERLRELRGHPNAIGRRIAGPDDRHQPLTGAYDRRVPNRVQGIGGRLQLGQLLRITGITAPDDGNALG